MGKDKKNKKQKEEEEVAHEQQEQEEPAVEEPVVEESPKKKKKKAKKQEAVVEEQESQEEEKPSQEEAEEEEENDFKVKSNKKRSHSESENGAQVDDAQLEKAFKQIGEVTDEFIDQLKSSAEKLAKKHKGDSLRALAAALVVMTGANKVPCISPLTQREGYTTYCLTKHDDEIRGKSFGFVIIKRILGEEEGDRAVSHITFSKDHKCLVFDIPTKYDEVIQEKWYDTASLEMKALGASDTLPELEEGSSGGGGGGGGRGGFGGGRGGGFGGGRGGGGRGGFGGGRGGGGRGGFGGGRGGGGRGGFGGGGRGGFSNGSNKKISFDNDD